MTFARVLAALAVVAILGLAVGGTASSRPQANFDVAVTVSVSGGVANSTLQTAAEGELTNHRFSSYSWSATFEFKGVPDAGNFSVDGGATGQASWTIDSSRRIGVPPPTCQSTLSDSNGSLAGRLQRTGGQLSLEVNGGFQADDPCATHTVSLIFAENLFRIFRPDAQTPIEVLRIPLPETIIRGASVTPQMPDYDDSYQYQYEELGDVLVATTRAQVRVTSECRAGGTCGRTAQVLDDRFPEPPPQLPPPVGRVLVQVSGGGTVTTTSAPAARRVQDTVAQIRCGTRGYACYAEAAPEATVTMRATPAPGQRFQSWTGGCEGRDSLCTVAAGAATTVGAVFVPARRGNVASVALRPPQLAVRWRRSVGKGTLVVRGSVGARAKVRVQLRRPRGGPLLTKVLSARGGFQLRAPLNKLAGGASLLPGGFVVSLTGTAGGAPIPLQVRTLSVPAPSEGVVRRAFVSASQTGRPARKLRKGAREAWATFQLAAQPTAAPITVSWYQGRRLVGSRVKNNRPVIQTGIGASAGLPSGTYRVDLVAGGRVVRRLNVKVAR